MTKKELFKIQQKYIDLLKWFEDNNFIPIDYFRSSNYYLEQHSNNKLEIYPNIKISRGYDYLEMGAPTKEDLTVYDLTCSFKFNIQGNEEVMKKWHYFIGKFDNDYDKKHNKPEVFNNCYFDTFYDNNPVIVDFRDYYGWSMFGADYENKKEYHSDESLVKNLNFRIPIIIEYKIKTIKL